MYRTPSITICFCLRIQLNFLSAVAVLKLGQECNQGHFLLATLDNNTHYIANVNGRYEPDTKTGGLVEVVEGDSPKLTNWFPFLFPRRRFCGAIVAPRSSGILRTSMFFSHFHIWWLFLTLPVSLRSLAPTAGTAVRILKYNKGR
jgi:hypothetical protein